VHGQHHLSSPSRNSLVGLPAKRQAAVNSANTAFAFKRLMGPQFTNKQGMKHWLVSIFSISGKI
jgi:molecular chaperone DnaK (HSP70)